jgi:hypothetical protein
MKARSFNSKVAQQRAGRGDDADVSPRFGALARSLLVMTARHRMFKPIACLLAFCVPFLVARVTDARDLAVWSTPIVCAQSIDESRAYPPSGRSFCLLRLAPLFDQASVEITPLKRTSFSRWGAQLELRF